MMDQSFTRDTIKNIYCVGRNFGLHAKELGNAIPDHPMIFTKPTHAVIEAAGVIPYEKSMGDIHHEVEIVLWIQNTYSEGITVDELVGGYAIGIDFTARDIQNVLKQKGHSWDLAKGFLRSAVIGPFQSSKKLSETLKHISFGLKKNGEIVQNGSTSDMIFDFQTIVTYIGKNFGLGKGDLIFTGTPEGVSPISDGDKLELLLEQRTVAEFTVELT